MQAIAIPICASTIDEAIKEIEQAIKISPLVEFRADFVKDINSEKIDRVISYVKKKRKKIILTIRRKSEGGKFLIKENKRISLLKALHTAPDFIDIEYTSLVNIKNIKSCLKLYRSKLIVSYHNLTKTDRKQIMSVYNGIKKLKPAIIKIAAFANDLSDNLVMFDLIKKAKKGRKKIIAICMGEKGEISRILGPMLGSEITFGSLAMGKESAPGQVPAEVLIDVYRANKLKNPRIFGLVGRPVSHSKGFLIHNNLFRQLSLKNVYLNFLVENLDMFMQDYTSIVSGMSVTIPYKQDVMKYLHKIDPIAKKIGAVNTVLKKSSKLIGYNTDVTGALEAIEKKIRVKGKKVLLIGAGGVGRAIAYGISEKGGNLIILNRTVIKARRLGNELRCKYGGLDRLIRIKNVDIIINGTSIGMTPNINETPVHINLLRSIIKKNKTVVFDSVYNPIETTLLKDAKSLNLQTISGVEMFVNQAVQQFELFTGKKAPKQLMKSLLK